MRLFPGVGYGTILATFMFSIYYAVIICWMLYYFIHSFFKILPWNTCDNDWNIQETCITSVLGESSGNTSVVSNMTTMVTNITTMASNITTVMADEDKMTSAEQFWKFVLYAEDRFKLLCPDKDTIIIVCNFLE